MYKEFVISMLIAYLLDKLFGDPENIPHPVVYMGKLISYLEKHLRKPGDTDKATFIKGCTAEAIVILTVGIIGSLMTLIPFMPLRVLLMTLTFFFCLAGETLAREAISVKDALGVSLSEGRKRIARIVGRDPYSLGEDGIIRACIETVAENTSDGITAPMFWGLLLGPAGSLMYKAVNTMDSMIGYRNERYEYYGKSAAITDDVLNFIPARLTALIAVILSPVTEGTPFKTLKVYLKNRNHHNSPNSGHLESSFAGALGIRLGGPASYEGKTEERNFINPDGRSPEREDITRSVTLMKAVSGMFLILFVLVITLMRLK